ncbi:MAG: DUF2066 domain-containing protein [Pseudomonadota bacterium]|nr:DUF2066 domain-containing protein [Pseudomonadota bacterium]
MKSALSLLILVALCGLAPGLRAAPEADFYLATVPVADHSEKARLAAARQGLVDVLVKLTGSSGIAARPAVAAMLGRVSSYMLEYSYATLPGEGDGAPGGLGVRVQFDRAGIDRFLRANQLPIWPLNRPRLLVWLLEDGAGGVSRFVAGEEAAPLVAALDRGFERRGMPAVYPLLDLQDQLVLDPQKARDFDVEAIAEASSRYPAQGWLVLRYYQTSDGEWRSAWMMGRDGQTVLRQQQADSLESLLAALVDQVVDTVAASASYVAKGSGEAIQLDVDGIATFRDYNRLVDLLAGLSMVRDVQVTGVDGRRLYLNLLIEGGREQLLDSLHRHPALEFLDATPSSGMSDAQILAGEAIAGPSAAGGTERLRWVGGR